MSRQLTCLASCAGAGKQYYETTRVCRRTQRLEIWFRGRPQR